MFTLLAAENLPLITSGFCWRECMAQSQFSISGRKPTYLSTAFPLVGMRRAIGRTSVAVKLKLKRPKLHGFNRLGREAELRFGQGTPSKRAMLTLSCHNR